MSGSGPTLSVRVPFEVKKRGGRKLIVTPEGVAAEAQRPRIDNTMVKALARAHRWRRVLESGKYATISELAAAEKINKSYLSRVLRLTLLAPDMVEAILDRRQPEGVTVKELLQPLPAEWEGKRGILGAIQ